jgi:hypothetical protein
MGRKPVIGLASVVLAGISALAGCTNPSTNNSTYNGNQPTASGTNGHLWDSTLHSTTPTVATNNPNLQPISQPVSPTDYRTQPGFTNTSTPGTGAPAPYPGTTGSSNFGPGAPSSYQPPPAYPGYGAGLPPSNGGPIINVPATADLSAGGQVSGTAGPVNYSVSGQVNALVPATPPTLPGFSGGQVGQNDTYRNSVTNPGPASNFEMPPHSTGMSGQPYPPGPMGSSNGAPVFRGPMDQ